MDADLKLDPKKCDFPEREVIYLACRSKGVFPLRRKNTVVQCQATPQTPVDYEDFSKPLLL